MTDQTELARWMRLKTEPLNQTELARWFGMSRKYIRPVIESIEGTVQVGTRWRIPLAEMPISYLRKMKLIDD